MRLLLTFSLFAALLPAGASAATFIQTLRPGSVGAEVRELQKILNADPATAVAASGPGSPGNETLFFGTATRKAVIAFQEKYRAEILAPNGLSSGTGVVGPSTRAVLENIVLARAVVPTYAATPSQGISPRAPVPPAITEAQAPSVPANPNLKNVDEFLASIDKMGAKQKFSAAKIATIKERALQELATTTDLRAAFLDTAQKKAAASRNESPLGNLLAALLAPLDALFGTDLAEAATGIPFGGKLIFPFFCEDSGNWWLTITPLPPSYVFWLAYEPFSQMYLSYNIPETTWLLGEYEPAGLCVFACPYCVEVEMGTISPVVGSSPS